MIVDSSVCSLILTPHYPVTIYMETHTYIYSEVVPVDHCLFLDGQSSPQIAMGRCPFSFSVYSQILHLQNPNHNQAVQHPN